MPRRRMARMTKMMVRCSDCNGRGRVPNPGGASTSTCPMCNGQGMVPGDREMPLTNPQHRGNAVE